MKSATSDFSADEFRSGIRAAMNMGLPENEADRATFLWTTTRTFSAADSSGTPFDFTEEPIKTVKKDPVQVPVAVEFTGRGSSGGTPVGTFHTPRVTITVLDEDYAQIEGADEVKLGGNTYAIDFVAPPIGLFEVTVYQLYCRAVSEV